MVGKRPLVPATAKYASSLGLTKAATPLDKISARKVVRRAQSKVNQRRYRAEQRQAFDALEGEVQELTNQVARYEGQVEALRSAVRLREPELKTALEYFNLFHDGFQVNAPSVAQVQRDFLSGVMAPNLIFMGQNGIAKLFEQWTLYHTLFHSFTMECPSLEIVHLDAGASVVRAPAVLYLRLSRFSIETLYPHVLRSEALVQQMVGRVLRMPVLCQFHFDGHGIVTRFDTFADVTVGLTEMLESFEDALTVLDGVRITAEAELQAPSEHAC
ncbi:hypothetical protein SPRG_20829 [Saprolegnia parasitica CBS 223.65]|uniref:BZIP domain-containing protein n=1 Tax=Saprolegnia parasitica (strain CBS 223.65) TaxID=695850 RepID=A0A067C2R7_SAPPC|nr:hypothetical protein SPRG_20829 [Saprolegnia parasitica CBS 223.65]KDO24798.1 hypothetical protein SPRG_20829 [Saprolegnia parasitica CBS 223.65]|eukprot:XP_012204531.1 hypothetical protein SPRG_20829 [Saprolegnia parasitica CBS 223.65]